MVAHAGSILCSMIMMKKRKRMTVIDEYGLGLELKVIIGLVLVILDVLDFIVLNVCYYYMMTRVVYTNANIFLWMTDATGSIEKQVDTPHYYFHMYYLHYY